MADSRKVVELRLLSVAVGICSVLATAGTAASLPPIMIDRMGAFAVGGKIVGDPMKMSSSCDHGYVEYSIPVKRRKVNLFMWHSASVAAWKNRWDGGEGYESIFLRQGYPVYLWDGPRVGRANYSCEAINYKLMEGRDQFNFTGWRFGDVYPRGYPGVQFPTGDREALNQAARAAYEEFDTLSNVLLQAEAAAKAFDRIGPTVVLTNSAGGLRALIAAMKTDTNNIRAIVAYENAGYVFPAGEYAVKDDPRYGPIHVSIEDFKKLTRFPIQLVFGDNIDKYKPWANGVAQARKFVEVLNAHGGKAELLLLPSVGLHGNTHVAFADMNNVEVANQLTFFLSKNGLTGYAAKQKRR